MLTGVEEKARSGRSDDMNEPIIEDMVGGESSEMSWYALGRVLNRQPTKDSRQWSHLIVVAAVNSAAQHTLRNTPTSVISPM